MNYASSSPLETATGAEVAREVMRRLKRRLLQDGLIGYVRLYAELLFGRRPETPEAAVDYCNRRPIPLRQVRSEVLAWTRLVAGAAPRRSLEIGTFRGGTLFLLCVFSPPDAHIISLDLPGGAFGGGYDSTKIPLFKRFTRGHQNLRLVRADSHLPETKARILKLLGDDPLDFLFIDGDHSYDGVKRDFEMYSPLVRPGGIIAFHDIAEHPPKEQCEVGRFWQEIKLRYPHREIVEDPRQGWAGIGILTVSGESAR
jgi:predicted O-methyltransferase YrrM